MHGFDGLNRRLVELVETIGLNQRAGFDGLNQRLVELVETQAAAH